jgi:hypothetical protein
MTSAINRLFSHKTINTYQLSSIWIHCIDLLSWSSHAIVIRRRTCDGESTQIVPSDKLNNALQHQIQMFTFLRWYISVKCRCMFHHCLSALNPSHWDTPLLFVTALPTPKCGSEDKMCKTDWMSRKYNAWLFFNTNAHAGFLINKMSSPDYRYFTLIPLSGATQVKQSGRNG